MKKILYLLGLSVIISLMVASCKIDNYEGPNGQISGKFLDKVTGELVGTDLNTGNAIGVYELGWPTENKQTWYIKNTGEYTNNLVFAATYRIEFTNCNFWPYIVPDFVVTKGANTHDFPVVPYIRVKNPAITYDAGTKIVTATFNLETDSAAKIKLDRIQLFAFTDMWVGNTINFGITTGGARKVAPADVSATIAATQYTLTMNVAAAENSTKFPVTRNYYFRIGALAKGGVGTMRFNYSPLVKITNIVRP